MLGKIEKKSIQKLQRINDASQFEGISFKVLTKRSFELQTKLKKKSNDYMITFGCKKVLYPKLSVFSPWSKITGYV